MAREAGRAEDGRDDNRDRAYLRTGHHSYVKLPAWSCLFCLLCCFFYSGNKIRMIVHNMHNIMMNVQIFEISFFTKYFFGYTNSSHLILHLGPLIYNGCAITTPIQQDGDCGYTGSVRVTYGVHYMCINLFVRCDVCKKRNSLPLSPLFFLVSKVIWVVARTLTPLRPTVPVGMAACLALISTCGAPVLLRRCI